MTSASFHHALLQPAVLQVLRAAGFNAAKPAALDTLTDLAARYLRILATSTAQNAINIHNSSVPTVQDVRLALSENGALFPQMTPDEEARKPDVEIAGEWFPFEDLRGVQIFVDWAHGSVNKEIRRIAGVSDDKLDVDLIAAGMEKNMDYLTSMKKHGGKADDDFRFQGTFLGKDLEPQPIIIAGGDPTLADFLDRYKAKLSDSCPAINDDEDGSQGDDADSSMLSSAPLSPAPRGGSTDVDISTQPGDSAVQQAVESV